MHHHDRKVFRFVQSIATVHTNQIQLKQSTDRLWLSLPGKTQQLAPLIHLLFFSMGGWTSFHLEGISFRSDNREQGQSGFIVHYLDQHRLQSVHKH